MTHPEVSDHVPDAEQVLRQNDDLTTVLYLQNLMDKISRFLL
jgi:hypothetical protein